MMLISSICLILSSTTSSTRTSNIDNGYCVVSQYNVSSSSGQDTVYLAKQVGRGTKKLIKLPVARFDRHIADKIVVCDDRIVILVASGAGRYVHYFVRIVGSKAQLQYGPLETDDSYVGSSSAVIVDNNILGVVWVSPDHSQTKSGNYMYVFGPAKLKFGLLPGSEEGYEIKASNSRRRFSLVRWQVNDSIQQKTTHDFPFSMKNGFWQLSGFN